MRRNLAIIAFILIAACIGVVAKNIVLKSNNLNSKDATTPSGSTTGYVEFTGTLDNSPATANKGVDLFQIAGIAQNNTPSYLDRDDLSSFTRWRYDRCLNNAADKPTEQGVNLALYLCKEQFLQRNN